MYQLDSSCWMMFVATKTRNGQTPNVCPVPSYDFWCDAANYNNKHMKVSALQAIAAAFLGGAHSFVGKGSIVLSRSDVERMVAPNISGGTNTRKHGRFVSYTLPLSLSPYSPSLSFAQASTHTHTKHIDTIDNKLSCLDNKATIGGSNP